jgi:hypothetical protein
MEASPGALTALRDLAPVVLYGEGFWQRPPSEAFLAALGDATVDELADLDGLRAAIRDVGFDNLARVVGQRARLGEV